MSEYLAASINLSDGRVLRIGPDEDQVGDIPTSFSFQTQIPGGFGPASLTIPRPPDLFADDARLFSNVVVYGEGMRIVYEGYVTGLPQQSQDEIQLQLTGWSTILDRIANFRQVFAHRDLTAWGPPPGPRRAERLSQGFSTFEGGNVEAGATESRLAFPMVASELVNGNTASDARELWFDAGPGLSIAKLYISRIEGGYTGSSSGGGHRIGFTNSDSPESNATGETDVPGNVVATDQTYIPATPTRYVYIRYQRNALPPGTQSQANVFGATVYGNHNLVLAGPQPRGVLGSEAIAYMVGPTPLNVLPESIEASDFIIPHLSFLSDISLREAIEQINILGGKNRLPNDWGVYENREFFWRSPCTYGKTWRVNKSNLSNVRSDGPDSALRTAGVKVNYQDPAGVTRSVGPPNSFSDLETSSLLSIDQDNPAFTMPGFHTETVGVTTQTGAINIGKVLLNERNRLKWRGDVDLQGEVMDSEGKVYPVHRIRAGDQIIVQDDDDKRPRPINSTTYNHDNLSLTASLGAVPDSLDSLLARLAAVTDLFV